MQAFMKAYTALRVARGKPAFAMRAGIHTGPVVAGVVGERKFQYDLWGDTVNTASRLETAGEPGLVNISGATYARLAGTPGLHFTPRGRIPVKGKGELEMYFVRVQEQHAPNGSAVDMAGPVRMA
jgi:class 3 adenylate cyclase